MLALTLEVSDGCLGSSVTLLYFCSSKSQLKLHFYEKKKSSGSDKCHSNRPNPICVIVLFSKKIHNLLGSHLTLMYFFSKQTPQNTVKILQTRSCQNKGKRGESCQNGMGKQKIKASTHPENSRNQSLS